MHVCMVCEFLCVCMEIAACEAESGVEKRVACELFSEVYAAECAVCLCVSVRQSKGGSVRIHRAPLY